MAQYIVKAQSINSKYGRPLFKNELIDEEQIIKEHLQELLDAKAIELQKEPVKAKTSDNGNKDETKV